MPVRKNAPAVPAIIPSITPRLLRVPQAAQYLGATNWCVEELVRNDKLPFIVVGKYRVIDVQDLDEWIDAEKQAQFAQRLKSAA